MHKTFFKLFFTILLLSSCGESARREATPRPLVYEGMSATELRIAIGEPNEIDEKSKIFDAESMTKISQEHWIYEKRTVLLINDTVKDPNIN